MAATVKNSLLALAIIVINVIAWTRSVDKGSTMYFCSPTHENALRSDMDTASPPLFKVTDTNRTARNFGVSPNVGREALRHRLQQEVVGPMYPDTGTTSPDTGTMPRDTGVPPLDTGILPPDTGMSYSGPGTMPPHAGAGSPALPITGTAFFP